MAPLFFNTMLLSKMVLQWSKKIIDFKEAKFEEA